MRRGGRKGVVLGFFSAKNRLVGGIGWTECWVEWDLEIAKGVGAALLGEVAVVVVVAVVMVFEAEISVVFMVAENRGNLKLLAVIVRMLIENYNEKYCRRFSNF